MNINSYNNLSVKIFQSSGKEIQDPDNSLDKAENITWSTRLDGGLFGDCRFSLPSRNIRRDFFTRAFNTDFTENRRIEIYNGFRLVYQGYITYAGPRIGQADRYYDVIGQGAWDNLGEQLYWDKIWADDRIDDDVWRMLHPPAVPGQEKIFIDRDDRIRFTPKAEAWLTGEFAYLRYDAPTGQTIKMIDYDYDMAEAAGANDWELVIRNATTAADVVSYTATGSATGQSHTFATPAAQIQFRFYARDNQTPPSDGTIYGEFSNILVYTETSAINLTEIAKDILGSTPGASWLNQYQGFIESNTLALQPFLCDGPESLASILRRACERGDSTGGLWYAAFRPGTDYNAGTIALPILQVKAYPTATSYEWEIGAHMINLQGASVETDYERVRNDITVHWTNVRGRRVYMTKADDANLTDTDSVARYGSRWHSIYLGQVAQAVALNAGYAALAELKSPGAYLTAPISIQGWINDSKGRKTPVCQIRAGQRILVRDYTITGTGLILVITQTEYDHDTQTVTISAGPPQGFDYVLKALRTLQEPARR